MLCNGVGFRQLGVDEIMAFLRGGGAALRLGRRQPGKLRRQPWNAGQHQRLGRLHRRRQCVARLGRRAASGLQPAIAAPYHSGRLHGTSGPGSRCHRTGRLADVHEAQRTRLPWACASLTAAAFALCRKRGRSRQKRVPDFYIGAHAAVSNLSVLTRDPAAYRSYFPRLRLVAP